MWKDYIRKTSACASVQGKFQGLDLNEELFVGGYPNYSMIAKTAELNSGFVGEEELGYCVFFFQYIISVQFNKLSITQ